jgi:hypothetical protein
VKLDHFFRGTIRKEDVASAFLATALEQSPRFREFFFRRVDADRADALTMQPWTYAVEKRRVDVTMQAADTTVVIENKICGGAMQAEQLVRYYKECVKDASPSDRVLAVYVAPRNLGRGEVQLVHDLIDSEPRGTDLAVHVSWEALAQFQSPDTADEEIVAGLRTILSVIDELKQPKYLREGDRDVVATMVDGALQLIRTRVPSVSLGRWTEAALEDIMTGGTNVTMWLDAVFVADEEPPYAPLNLWDGARLNLKLRVKFKLAGHVKKADPLSGWWQTNVLKQLPDIEGVGQFGSEGKGWLVYLENMSDAVDVIEHRMADLGALTLQWLEQRLGAAGFSLLRTRP